MRQTKKMKSKVVSIVLALLLVAGCVHLNSVQVKAAIPNKAIDFQIGDKLEGNTSEADEIVYYRFKLDSKQRILIKGQSGEKNRHFMDDIRIMDEKGNDIFFIYGYQNDYWSFDEVTNVFSLEMAITLNKGTYYFAFYRAYKGAEYSFITEYAPSINYPSIQLTLSMNKGDSLKLGTVIEPKKAASKLKWTSSDKSVAGVSSKGTVKAKKIGTATVTASCNGSKIRIKIIVK